MRWRGPRSWLRRARRASLGVALGVTLAGCAGGENEAGAGSGPPPVTVEVVTVQPESIRDLVDIPGQLTAELSVVVTTEIEGLIESIHFAEGAAVEQGDVLFRMRNREQLARVREAEAELALAEDVYRRTLRLQRRDVSSTAQLDRAAAERDVAKARVEVARVELERTVVRAPFDGVMGALLVSPGDHVEPETELVRIDAIDRLQLHLTLPEVALGVVRTGVPVEIEVAPYPGERFPGEVYFVSPTLDPASRRVLIKAWIPNPDHRLRPGLFAQVRAEVGRREDALVLPESALIPGLDGTYVWRVGESNVAQRVPVETGLRQEGRVEIARGLAPGDRVVAAGTNKVTAGRTVSPVDAHATEQADGGPAQRSGS